MSFELRFKEAALDEWKRLDGGVREQFRKKLVERLESPRVPSAKLSGHPDRYKIKLSRVGYRLVYEVRDAEVVVVIIAVGKRERNAVYEAAAKR
ncbi:MAG: type II toxin-antitoxin system RelE/ParE family toxin [Serpentinimonas sp.]|nr:type II toxin-antitoxin system RelE/ParE family toxin [Serpentinimonas sp.]